VIIIKEVTMKEVETCPKCDYYGIMEAIGRLNSSKTKYICPNCKYQFEK
jgi:transposase-like protein